MFYILLHITYLYFQFTDIPYFFGAYRFMPAYKMERLKPLAVLADECRDLAPAYGGVVGFTFRCQTLAPAAIETFASVFL